MAHGMLGLNPGAITHSLEIVLGDRPATVLGRVTSHNGPMAGAYLAIYEWPLDVASPSTCLKAVARADSGGSFRISRLPAGRYRLVAFAPPAPDSLRDLPMLLSLLDKAKDLILDEGEIRDITLEVSGP